jgi:hypothetical protein
MASGDAKRDLCAAIIDRRIAIQAYLAPEPDRQLPGLVVSDPPFPPRLAPLDFDWPTSRPRAPWPLFPQQSPRQPITIFAAEHFHLIDRTIDLIEVSTSDVSTVLLGLDKGHGAKAAGPRTADTVSPVKDTQSPSAFGKTALTPDPILTDVPAAAASGGPEPTGAKSLAVWQAIQTIWPNGIPETITAIDRNNQIRNRLSSMGQSIPQDIGKIVQRLRRQHP